jgi:nitroimidazol reductase NimA-like FMN-containing flavoprotein (pyridoxamine 5'-phosphate oxidase superfamily)
MYENVESGQLTKEQIDHCLAQPLLARMATASAGTLQPHVVPVWYLWDGQSIWVHGFRSTRKFRELVANPRCAIVIDDAASGVDFWSVLFEGQAELITDRDVVHPMAERIYTRYIGADGVLDPTPQSWIHDEESLLLKLTPSRTVTWYSRTKPLQQP